MSERDFIIYGFCVRGIGYIGMMREIIIIRCWFLDGIGVYRESGRL